MAGEREMRFGYGSLRYVFFCSGSHGLPFFQRVFAAFRAIALRFAGDSLAARAAPPFAPPSLPKATAAGFRVSGFGAGFGTKTSPVTPSTMEMAIRFGSGRRGLLARVGIL